MNALDRLFQDVEKLGANVWKGLTTANPSTGETPMQTILSMVPAGLQIMNLLEDMAPGTEIAKLAAGAVSALSTITADASAAQAAAPALTTALTNAKILFNTAKAQALASVAAPAKA